jgi:hypothetical protein
MARLFSTVVCKGHSTLNTRAKLSLVIGKVNIYHPNRRSKLMISPTACGDLSLLGKQAKGISDTPQKRQGSKIYSLCFDGIKRWFNSHRDGVYRIDKDFLRIRAEYAGMQGREGCFNL